VNIPKSPSPEQLSVMGNAAITRGLLEHSNRPYIEEYNKRSANALFKAPFRLGELFLAPGCGAYSPISGLKSVQPQSYKFGLAWFTSFVDIETFLCGAPMVVRSALERGASVHV